MKKKEKKKKVNNQNKQFLLFFCSKNKLIQSKEKTKIFVLVARNMIISITDNKVKQKKLFILYYFESSNIIN